MQTLTSSLASMTMMTDGEKLITQSDAIAAAVAATELRRQPNACSNALELYFVPAQMTGDKGIRPHSLSPLIWRVHSVRLTASLCMSLRGMTMMIQPLAVQRPVRLV